MTKDSSDGIHCVKALMCQCTQRNWWFPVYGVITPPLSGSVVLDYLQTCYFIIEHGPLCDLYLSSHMSFYCSSHASLHALLWILETFMSVVLALIQVLCLFQVLS